MEKKYTKIRQFYALVGFCTLVAVFSVMLALLISALK